MADTGRGDDPRGGGGGRARSDKLVRELVLADPAPFVPLAMKKRGKEIDCKRCCYPT